jgi:glycosyltransferase involved in cell wall biosynthesis
VVSRLSAARVATIADDRDGVPADIPQQTLTALIVVPTLQAGAADSGAVELVRILAAAGHRPIVVSRGGRMVSEVIEVGGEHVQLDMSSRNPIVMLRNATTLTRIVRERRCNLIHAHGRAPAWSALAAARLTRVPFLTTWHKGFREQNVLKRLYNGVMARGDRVVAVSDQIAELVNDRYGTPWDRIAVVPASVDVDRFDPASVAAPRIAAVRAAWGIGRSERIILVPGRMLRRKGQHVVVQAMRRLKAMGVKDFVCVLAAQDRGTRYAGELWDLVLATDTADVVRMVGPIDDLPAAYAAATVVVSAAVQPEGLQRALLEAQAMERPVIVSDLGAGPDVVLAPPTVPHDRMTGLRFPARDDAALVEALIRLFSLPDSAQRAIGTRGRAWVLGHFDVKTVSELTLKLYAETVSRHSTTAVPSQPDHAITVR